MPDPMFLLGLGGFCPWYNVTSGGGLCRETPPESEKRAVRILLECFLATYTFCHSSEKTSFMWCVLIDAYSLFQLPTLVKSFWEVK